MQEPWEREWRDYYAVLGCKSSASPRQLRSAFRRLAHRYHPDVSEYDGSQFKMISEAYEVLSDASRRRRYEAAYRRVTHGLPLETRILVDPPEGSAKTQGQRRHVEFEATLRFDGIGDDALNTSMLDVSCADPQILVRGVAAEWIATEAGRALRVRWQADVFAGGDRRIDVVYRFAGHAAVQRVDIKVPRFALYHRVATSRGIRTLAFGLPWLDVGLERTILVPTAVFFATVFGALALGDANQHIAARAFAWSAGLATVALSLALLNAFLATNEARYRFRRVLPILLFVLGIQVLLQLLRAFG